MFHTFAPALRRRVDWRVGEIGFRLWEEREVGKEKGRKKYLDFCLEEMMENLIFVVPKANNVLWNYEVDNQARYERSRQENLLVFLKETQGWFLKRQIE
jgi:hypothetical protein